MNDYLSTAALMGLLLLVVVGLAARPWWRTGPVALRRRAANVAAYRSRVDELAVEERSGLITAQDSGALQAELESRLLADALEAEPEAEASGAPRPARAWVPMTLLAVLLSAFAVGGYFADGSWRVQQQIGEGARSEDQVEAMVHQLAEKMQREPDNADGWALLGRSYFVQQHYDEAAKSYAQANAHAPQPNPEWLADEGEALAFARDRDLLGRPAQLFAQALQLDPDFGKALWYAGLAADQAKDGAQAVALWTRLAKQDLPPEMREILQQRLGRLQAEPSASQSPVVSAGAGPASVDASGPVLHVHVSLDARIADQLPADAALFVFAKAEQGPPMPLAVQRFAKVTLPVDVTLDDSKAMTAAMTLSQFDHYVVTARVSRAGGALPVSGDLQGSLHVARAESGKPLQLVIDSVVP